MTRVQQARICVGLISGMLTWKAMTVTMTLQLPSRYKVSLVGLGYFLEPKTSLLLQSLTPFKT